MASPPWQRARAAVYPNHPDVVHTAYARADYVERWNQFFDWGAAASEPQRQETEDVLALVSAMRRQGISRRALADGIGADPSFVSKLLNGKKTWPAYLLARSKAWLAGTREEVRRLPASAWPSLPMLATESDCLLDVALAYRARLVRGAATPRR